MNTHSKHLLHNVSALLISCLCLACSQQQSQAKTHPVESEISKPEIGIVTELPEFSGYADITAKKAAFFNFLRPIVENENRKVLEQRKQMLSLREKMKRNKPLPESEQQWLLELAAEYRIDLQDIHDQKLWILLNRRVDTVPFRLALAQAANESAWGTSRFARDHLNLFGMWCFKPGCGVVPIRRKSDMTHEVAVFKSVNASVAAYIRSINRVRMYTPLRRLRHEIRSRGEKPTALELAQELTGYSERGEAYVQEIQHMIRVNYQLMSGTPSALPSNT